MKGDRYPRATATLERLLQASPARPSTPLTPFAIGPAVLREPPPRAEPMPVGAPLAGPSSSGTPVGGTEELLGELVDMVFVSADDDAGSGRHEVRLVFKAEVLGGLHLRLVHMPDGMHATFVVEDAAARRAVAAHVDDLVRHLLARGFVVTHHAIELAAP
ncbi:MAG: flagellar hook-length control protein FliK [Deltaproteobacteria bacterium]|nr:flagellar hook-length control protein FliK [Deltaproteobacteria bacterium]